MFDIRDCGEMDDQQLEALYTGHVDDLIAVAAQFSIPAADAEKLAHEIILSSLHKPSKIVDLRSWLIGGMTCAAGHFHEGKR
jgi:DNA-directed RNA polymerase specialized sigma24 family protein